jgi:hypothetical protein
VIFPLPTVELYHYLTMPSIPCEILLEILRLVAELPQRNDTKSILLNWACTSFYWSKQCLNSLWGTFQNSLIPPIEILAGDSLVVRHELEVGYFRVDSSLNITYAL